MRRFDRSEEVAQGFIQRSSEAHEHFKTQVTLAALNPRGKCPVQPTAFSKLFLR